VPVTSCLALRREKHEKYRNKKNTYLKQNTGWQRNNIGGVGHLIICRMRETTRKGKKKGWGVRRTIECVKKG